MASPSDIAPCGINCTTCLAYQRQKNHCDGCKSFSARRHYCSVCKINKCSLLEKTENHLCYECHKFPCQRLKQLNKRYITKYNTSLIENLKAIKTQGMSLFLQSEKEKWTCKNCGLTLCVHREGCKCTKPVKGKHTENQVKVELTGSQAAQ